MYGNQMVIDEHDTRVSRTSRFRKNIYMYAGRHKVVSIFENHTQQTQLFSGNASRVLRRPRSGYWIEVCELQVAELHGADNEALLRKLHKLERHIRENKLRFTFSDELGRAQEDQYEVTSKKEARKVAFYLFWNVRPTYDR